MRSVYPTYLASLVVSMDQDDGILVRGDANGRNLLDVHLRRGHSGLLRARGVNPIQTDAQLMYTLRRAGVQPGSVVSVTESAGPASSGRAARAASLESSCFGGPCRRRARRGQPGWAASGTEVAAAAATQRHGGRAPW